MIDDAIYLKKCPFCGGDPMYREDQVNGGEFIECSSCYSCSVMMRPKRCDERELLSERWNARTDCFNEGLDEHISDLLDAMEPFVASAKDRLGSKRLSIKDWDRLAKAYDHAVTCLRTPVK